MPALSTTAEAWAIDWITSAFFQEHHVNGGCCERLAARAAALLPRHQGKALQPAPWNTSLPAPEGQDRTADELAAVVASLAQVAGMDPVLMLKDGMGIYTGVPEEDREVF